MAKQYDCGGPKPIPGLPKKVDAAIPAPTVHQPHIDRGHVNVRNPGKHTEKLRHG